MSRHLITSALPYINGVKHLGNLVGSMLPADVYARFRRLEGHEVLFVCSTDEHGTPAELAAAAAGQDVADYCTEQYAVQSALAERFGLSWDWFGRTSRPQNHELTQHFARALEREGYLEVRSTRQVYSVTDGRFLPDRYVIGTCPNCGYERARGDQCEHCTKPLDPTDLIEPRSAISGSTDLEVRETAHLYLLQSRLAERIRAWIDTKALPIEAGGWPPVVTGTAYKWLDEGLQDRCITRDLAWGVPVPADTFPDLAGKVFYVWFDAPIGYIAATREWADEAPDEREWEAWWRTDRGADDVTYTEFMGKDNVPFHTLSFPATLLGSGEPWKLVDQLKGFNYLNYEGGKFSTSLGRGVFMDDALELLPADYWRWYLIAHAPESSDTNFTWELFGDAVNKDLVGTFGNFVNRTATQVGKHFGDVVPEAGEPDEVEAAFRARVGESLTEHLDCFGRLEFRKGAAALRALWADGNVYLEQREPWRSVKVDRERTACTLRHALWLAGVAAVVSASVVPEASARLAAAFGGRLDGLRVHPGLLDDVAAALPAGSGFESPGLLFRKLEAETLDEWELRFSGGEDA